MGDAGDRVKQALHGEAPGRASEPTGATRNGKRFHNRVGPTGQSSYLFNLWFWETILLNNSKARDRRTERADTEH